MSDLKKELLEQLQSYREDLENDWEEVINNALDIIYKVNMNGEMRGFEIQLSVGGPSIYLDETGLHGYWSDEEYHLPVNKRIISEIWNYLEELKTF
jgi:hypothetical protein